MYVKIIDEETKNCQVGTGTNVEFYQSVGMSEMEVEQAYDGHWYVKGFTLVRPVPTKEDQKVTHPHSGGGLHTAGILLATPKRRTNGLAGAFVTGYS